MSGIGLVDKHLEELGIALAVFDREDIGVQSGNGVEEVLELRVAEMAVNLGGVLDTSSGETERIDGPLEVSITLASLAERKTFTESWLVNLNDINAGSLKIDNFITESQGKLL